MNIDGRLHGFIIRVEYLKQNEAILKLLYQSSFRQLMQRCYILHIFNIYRKSQIAVHFIFIIQFSN